MESTQASHSFNPSRLHIQIKIRQESEINMAHQFEPLQNDLIVRTAWGAHLFFNLEG
jgi:hypothetical protein